MITIRAARITSTASLIAHRANHSNHSNSVHSNSINRSTLPSCFVYLFSSTPPSRPMSQSSVLRLCHVRVKRVFVSAQLPGKTDRLPMYQHTPALKPCRVYEVVTLRKELCQVLMRLVGGENAQVFDVLQQNTRDDKCE